MLIKGLKMLKTIILPDNGAQVRRGWGREGSAEVQPKTQVSHFFLKPSLSGLVSNIFRTVLLQNCSLFFILDGRTYSLTNP